MPNKKNQQQQQKTLRVCPYAQRVLIALAEKGVPFDQLELATKDPRSGQWGIPMGDAKPKWFTSLAPEGKVPTVLYKEEGTVHVVTESLVILEFVEDYGNAMSAAAGGGGGGGGASTSQSSSTSQPPSLLPPHPATRAAARLAAKRFDERFVPPFYALLRGGLSAEEQKKQKDVLTKELEWLEAHADAAGPYYNGACFSMADAALIPFFLRMFELKARSGFEIPARCEKLIRWYGACASRESVIGTLNTPPEVGGDGVEEAGGGEGGAGAGGSGSGAAAASSDGNDWEVALTKFFVGYLGPRPTESAAA